MNDNAHLELVSSLLECEAGTETAVLEAHTELVNAELVRTLLAIAQMMREENDPELEQTIEWLNGFAAQLAAALGLEMEMSEDGSSRLQRKSTYGWILDFGFWILDFGLKLVNSCLKIVRGFALLGNSQEQFEFLMIVFSAIEKSGGNPQVIYPLFQANLAHLNEKLIHLLLNWYDAKLTELEGLDRLFIADVVAVFANLLQQFPRNRPVNLEIAINCYRSALEVCTREAFPEQWAETQMNLAVAYRNRIRGGRADNLERSIEGSSLALEVFTRDAFPEDWAMIQMNLASAYRKRIRGKKADNLEQSIELYFSALEVYTRDAYPEQWAETQINLANTYPDRIRGEKVDNLEQSIRCCELALEVFTREAFPEQWARTQNNLGLAYQRVRYALGDNTPYSR